MIEFLGYHTNEAKKAAYKFVDLVRSSGGEIATYFHLKDEVAGILTKYARDATSRASMTLEYLDLNQYDEVNTIRLRDSLEETLKKHNILLEEAKPIESIEPDDWQSWELELLTQSLVNSSHRQSSTDRITNDIRSVASVFETRKGYDCSLIENCKAILVTSNHSFAREADKLYIQTSKNKVSPVISDIDITALLWLRSWDKKNDVPKMVLLECAYAACRPTPELMDAFLRNIDILEKEGRITDDEALLLRTQPAPREDLISRAQNDASAVTDKMVLEIKENYEYLMHEKSQRRIDELTAKLNEQEKKQEKKKNDAINDARNRALDKSKNQTRKLEMFCIFVAIIVLLIGLIAYITTSFPWGDNALWQIIIVILSALSLCDMLSNKQVLIKRYLTRFQESRYAALYQKYLEDVKKYFD